MSDVSVIIPARYNSSRFWGKPLALINKIPMIIRVAAECKKAFGKQNTYVVTDDHRIKELVCDYGFKVIFTPSNMVFKTGTDRVAYAAEQLDSYFIINAQGDEPLVNHLDLIKIYSAMISKPLTVFNLYNTCDLQEAGNTNTIKVVANKFNKLMYMSRSPIPNNGNFYKKQIGVYGYTRPYLAEYFGEEVEKTPLENAESIEILRLIESGVDVHMLKSTTRYQSVDTAADIAKVEAILNERQ